MPIEPFDQSGVQRGADGVRRYGHREQTRHQRDEQQEGLAQQSPVHFGRDANSCGWGPEPPTLGPRQWRCG